MNLPVNKSQWISVPYSFSEVKNTRPLSKVGTDRANGRPECRPVRLCSVHQEGTVDLSSSVCSGTIVSWKWSWGVGSVVFWGCSKSKGPRELDKNQHGFSMVREGPSEWHTQNYLYKSKITPYIPQYSELYVWFKTHLQVKQRRLTSVVSPSKRSKGCLRVIHTTFK